MALHEFLSIGFHVLFVFVLIGQPVCSVSYQDYLPVMDYIKW